MNILNFLWGKTLTIVFNIVGGATVAVFVAAMAGGLPAGLIAGGWCFALAVYLIVEYRLLKARVERAKRIADETADKFLLGEIAEEPRRIEDRVYFELMTLQGRAAIARVHEAEKQMSEYYDYVQEWVHEIKIPITAIGLICNRSGGAEAEEIARQTARIFDYAEQALYAAKSTCADRDKLITRCEPSRIVGECIKENKRYFIDSGARIETDVDGFVYTDGKWLAFVLKQILYNCVQYSRGEAFVRITSRTVGDKYELSVLDNGIGIPESELPRVFDKGFTGSNGRRNKKSTGMGLYLCKKLCDALDIELKAQSVCGEYTKMTLYFNVARR